MNFKIILVIAGTILSILGQNLPSSDTLAVLNLIPNLSITELFDGPASISHNSTKPTTNSKPPLEDLIYYSNYAAATYCVDAKQLSCSSCQYFKNDVNDYTVLKNNSLDILALITLSVSREEIVVTYRGTSNLWNLISDLTTIAISYPHIPKEIKLHLGFYVATMSLYEDVIKNVGFLLLHFPNYKLKIIGHSLGGAMARLTAFFIFVNKQFPRTPITVITYGEPRSGNIAFANYMNFQNITTARVVNKADLIAHLPPTSILGLTILGDYYVQCETEYWINEDDEGKFCNQNFYEDPNCSASLGPGYCLLNHFYYFDADYLECIIEDFLEPIPTIITRLFDNIPPQPKKILDFNFLSAAVNFVFYLLDSVVDIVLGLI